MRVCVCTCVYVRVCVQVCLCVCECACLWFNDGVGQILFARKHSACRVAQAASLVSQIHLATLVHHPQLEVGRLDM